MSYAGGERVIVTDPVNGSERAGETAGPERDGRVWVVFDHGSPHRERFSVRFLRAEPPTGEAE